MGRGGEGGEITLFTSTLYRRIYQEERYYGVI